MSRRLAQLALALKTKRLWLRHSYRFNWAHKPLCARFQGGVLRWGSVYVCRSCVMAWSGIVTGSIVGLAAVLTRLVPEITAWIFGMVLLGVVFFSWPNRYKTLSRSFRDLLRFLVGALIPWALALVVVGFPWAGLVGLALLAGFWLLYFRGRKRRKAHECDGCPELGSGEICSGFSMQAQHLSRYQREATELLATGSPPEFLLRENRPLRPR